MANPATNTSTRPMLNTMDENYVTIRYRPKVSEKYRLWLKISGILEPWSCMFCKADEFYQSTYYQVLENRIEWNFPGLRPFPFTCCSLTDNFGGVYFDDRTVRYVGRAGCLAPIHHVGCFPTCCDICGEGIVTYSHSCCCTIYRILRFVEDADTFRDQVRDAIKARTEGGGAPAPVDMAQ